MMKNVVRKLVLLVTAVFLLTALSGCQCWNAWLDMLKWRMADGQLSQSGNADLANNAIAGNGTSAGPVSQAIVPRVIVHRITAPAGTFTANEKVWNELSEDALDSKTSVLLSQNGLRAGIAPASRWPNIKKLIDDVPGISADQILCQTDGRSSVSIMTRQNITEQIVISIDRDLQQQGRTFEKCDNGFKLSIRGLRDKPQLLISIEPFVSLGSIALQRTDRGELGITAHRGITAEESFPDLQMSAALAADHFLLISSVDPKANQFSIGSLWLADTEKVPAVETVLIFVPATPTK